MTTPQGLLARGACYGYEVRSELEFNYLRVGGGDPLEIAAGAPPDRPPGALLREWLPPQFPTHARLHADGESYRAPATIDDPTVLAEIAEALRGLGYAKAADA